jgi:hypothetical protein
MEVGSDRGRLDGEELQQMIGGSFTCLEGCQVADVADVLAHDRPVSGHQAESRLEFAADGQDGRPVACKPDRHRRVAAGATNRQRGPDDTPHDRVVAGHVDAAVVQQKAIGEPAEPLDGLGVAGGDRLAGKVARGHHQRRQPLGQQVLERRSGQHDSDKVVARGDGIGQAGAGTLGNEHDRPRGAREEPGGLLVDAGEQTGDGEIGGHHREGLGRPVLAIAKPGDRCGTGGVAGEVEAPEILDGQNPAAVQQLPGRGDRLGGLRWLGRPVGGGRRAGGGGGREQPDDRPASWAGDRLGMKATVGRVGILRGTHRTHRE